MRTELYLKGVQPPPLGSPRDNTLREMQYRQKQAEAHKHMATMAASNRDLDAANEYRQKYIDSLLHMKVKETRHKQLLKEYASYKDLTPELYTDSEGNKSVRGLR